MPASLLAGHSLFTSAPEPINAVRPVPDEHQERWQQGAWRRRLLAGGSRHFDVPMPLAGHAGSAFGYSCGRVDGREHRVVADRASGPVHLFSERNVAPCRPTSLTPESKTMRGVGSRSAATEIAVRIVHANDSMRRPGSVLVMHESATNIDDTR